MHIYCYRINESQSSYLCHIRILIISHDLFKVIILYQFILLRGFFKIMKINCLKLNFQNLSNNQIWVYHTNKCCSSIQLWCFRGARWVQLPNLWTQRTDIVFYHYYYFSSLHLVDLMRMFEAQQMDSWDTEVQDLDLIMSQEGTGDNWASYKSSDSWVKWTVWREDEQSVKKRLR